jgi:hypothetical protein
VVDRSPRAWEALAGCISVACTMVGLAGARANSSPTYPSAYSELNRVGEVAARYDVSVDNHLSNCRVLAEEGGKKFADAVMTWLAGPHSAAERDLPKAHGPTRDYYVTFIPDGYRGLTLGPVSWRASPPEPNSQVLTCGFIADCAVKSDGVPQDCRIVGLPPDDPGAIAALGWLRDADVHYQVWPDIDDGARRLITLTPDKGSD